MGDVDKIVRLLKDDDKERRIAAARVLGAIKAKGATVFDALVALLTGDDADERRAAAIALGEIRAAKALTPLVDALLDPISIVSAAAADAVRNFGDSAVKPLQRKLDVTTADRERSVLSTALASLGGASATHALLDGLEGATDDSARSAALRFRQEIKHAPEAERKEHRAVIEAFLRGEPPGAKQKASSTKATKATKTTKTSKAAAKKQTSKTKGDVDSNGDVALASPPIAGAGAKNENARAAAVKMLGFVEDRAALSTLIGVATDATEATSVRQEAVVATRFALGSNRKAPKVQEALVALLHSAPPTLARAAMDTLQNLILDDTATKGLRTLAEEGPRDIAQFSVMALASLQTKAATKALTHLVHHGQPIERAQAAASALSGQKAATPLILDVLKDDELLGGNARVVLCADVLASNVDTLTSTQSKKLVEATVQRIEAGTAGYEALVKVARDAAPEALADALRALVTTLRRKKKPEKAAAVLGLLERGDGATNEDRFRHAVLELAQSRKDTRPQARSRDPALSLFAELLDDGVDLMRLLAKEKSVDDEARFYLGWHFIEDGHSFGEEILDDLIARRPRTKLAKMAKNKKNLELDD